MVCNSAALRRFPGIQAPEFENNSALQEQSERLASGTCVALLAHERPPTLDLPPLQLPTLETVPLIPQGGSLDADLNLSVGLSHPQGAKNSRLAKLTTDWGSMFHCSYRRTRPRALGTALAKVYRAE